MIEISGATVKSDISHDSVRLAIIGTGLMGRHHLRVILENFPHTSIPVVCEPDLDAFDEAAQLFVDADRTVPDNEPNLQELLAIHGERLDAVFLITPHALHHHQTVACLEADLDVLLEKPMVMNEAEARSLIQVRDKSKRLLVVAFNGTLSPEIRKAASMLKSSEMGEILSISATIWQDWRQLTTDTWRQEPAISGGGFLMDTGAHMLNTVADLAGEDFTEIAAWFDNRGTAVEINGVAIGRLTSGAMVSLHGSGETIPSCDSEILVFCSEGILRTGAWGGFLEVQRPGESIFTPVKVPSSTGVWDQFLAIRKGKLPNPAPPEVGFRLARLYGALVESAETDGRVVRLDDTPAF
jgi:predicted dehydrogenase